MATAFACLDINLCRLGPMVVWISIFIFAFSQNWLCAEDPPPLDGWKENEIHDYADQTACEMGGREQSYLSQALNVLGNSGQIPMRWNEKEVTQSSSGEFLFDGKSAMVNPPDGRRRRIREFRELKCDHPSYVGKPTPCAPGQRILQTKEGAILWTVLLRGLEVSSARAHFEIVAAIGFNTDSYGTIWFDTVGNDNFDPGFSAQFFDSGKLPRAGGLNPQLRLEGVKASRMYARPARMARCFDCHTTPLIGSDWLTQAGAPKIKYDGDDRKPAWAAGNGILKWESLKVFHHVERVQSGTVFKTNCGGCHSLWGVYGDQKGNVAKFMTSILEQPEFQASQWRLDQSVGLDSKKDARKTHMMPVGHGLDKVAKWESTWKQEFEALNCCLSDPFFAPDECKEKKIRCVFRREDGSESDVPEEAPIPKFYSQREADKNSIPKGPAQFISAPDESENTSAIVSYCPPEMQSSSGSSARCFKLTWEDGSNPYNAAREYNVSTIIKSVSAGPFSQNEMDSTKYCDSSQSTSQLVTKQFLGGFRFGYKSIGLIPQCSRIFIRLCGNWCNAQVSGGVSTVGRSFVLENSDPSCTSSSSSSSSRTSSTRSSSRSSVSSRSSSRSSSSSSLSSSSRSSRGSSSSAQSSVSSSSISGTWH